MNKSNGQYTSYKGHIKDIVLWINVLYTYKGHFACPLYMSYRFMSAETGQWSDP